jgi:hypothetical protein
MKYEDIDGHILELNNDFTYVTTDRFDTTDRIDATEGIDTADGGSSLKEEFERFAIKVADKRLKAYGYDNTIVSLLPSQKEESKKGFEARDYSGIKSIVTLSSSIIRDFLELCKDMIYYSNLEIIKNGSSRRLNPVPPNIQNTVIRIHSNLLYDSIESITGIDEESKRSRSETTRLLIDTLGKIFHTILTGSKSHEKRTVSGFQLRDRAALNTIAAFALGDAVSYRLLRIPLIRRSPQNPLKYGPLDRYKFSRLLCPRFRLSLADRWPKEISARLINEIVERRIDEGKSDETVRKIVDYFMEDVPFIASTRLTDFEGDID